MAKGIYIVVVDYAADSEQHVELAGAYKNEENAQKCLANLADTEKNRENTFWNEDDEQFEDFIDDANEFSCWEGGRYAENHYTVTIKKTYLE